MFLSPDPFFQPTPAFLAWMAEHYGKAVVIDVGCGYGNFVAALLANGCPGALGIELLDAKLEAGMARYPEAAGRLVVGDSTRSSIMQLAGGVLVFARPCHHAGWIRATVEWTAKTARGWLYISKPGNAVKDLDGFERKRVATDIEVGADDEEAWEFRPVPAKFADYENAKPVRWCLVDIWAGGSERGSARREWVRDGGDRWYWGWSPSHCSKRDEVVIEDAWVADDDWLDRTKTTGWQRWHERVNDTSLDNGWVSPAGRLYRCAYWEHDALCYEYLRREVRDLENEGWCKLQRSSAMDRHNFVMARRFPGEDGPDHRLTREQVQALLDAGFVPPIYMLEEAEGDWSELVEKLWAVELGGDNA